MRMSHRQDAYIFPEQIIMKYCMSKHNAKITYWAWGKYSYRKGWGYIRLLATAEWKSIMHQSSPVTAFWRDICWSSVVAMEENNLQYLNEFIQHTIPNTVADVYTYGIMAQGQSILNELPRPAPYTVCSMQPRLALCTVWCMRGQGGYMLHAACGAGASVNTTVSMSGRFGAHTAGSTLTGPALWTRSGIWSKSVGPICLAN